MRSITLSFALICGFCQGVLLALFLVGSCQAESIYDRPTAYGKKYEEAIFKGKTLRRTFNFNTEKTTPYGPAYANIAPPDQRITCNPPLGRRFNYALCYYSGPSYPTGFNPSNPALPCKLSKDGVYADCSCLLITTDGTASEQPYYVGLDVISNLDIYRLQMETCGSGSEKCTSMGITPPVCEALNVNLLVPGADVISVYSEALQSAYYPPGDTSGSTNCATGFYAGCMTSPCERTGKFDATGREIVNCKCPVYFGPHEIGQAGQSCDANRLPTGLPGPHANDVRYVWSAKYDPSALPQ